ncbi:hypothetical protein [Sphingosinicella soli]|uniref:Putative membrane protein n=1 Tax=Sphingosinicella soli TaxID=333708 RepID=A0A7W7AYP7_9SPHN|nr:hypothetical protein [Sphingosinicella soli]MBB4630820.1 putative membrane protein [Sphingosinicella soli]
MIAFHVHTPLKTALAAAMATLAVAACAPPQAAPEPETPPAPQAAVGERCVGLAAIRNTSPSYSPGRCVMA